MWGQLARLITIGSQWAFGSVLERWFGGDETPPNPNAPWYQGLGKKILIGVIASVAVIYVVKNFLPKKWKL